MTEDIVVVVCKANSVQSVKVIAPPPARERFSQARRCTATVADAIRIGGYKSG